MQNYMRTILSGLQNWVNKRLHETVPETDTAHQQFVTDADGNAVWEEKLAWKEVTTEEVVNLEATELIGEDENGDGTMDGFYLVSPWLVDPVIGNTYKIDFNGTEYDCYAIDYCSLESTAPTGSIMFGNLDALGVTGIEGSNPNAPFVFMGVPNASGADIGGLYGMLMPFDETTISATISVNGVVATTKVKALDPDLLPDEVKPKQITLTIDEDGNVTSDTSFETAWAMSNAELQNAIVIKETGTRYILYDNHSEMSAVSVSRVQHTSDSFRINILQIRCMRCVDWEDVGLQSDDILSVKWEQQVADEEVVSEEATLDRVIQGLPDLSSMGGIDAGIHRFLRGENGAKWYTITLDEMQAELGLSHGADNAGNLLSVGADGFAAPIQLGDKLEVVDGVVNAKKQQCYMDWNNSGDILNRTHFEETGYGTYVLDESLADKSESEVISIPVESSTTPEIAIRIIDSVPSLESLENAQMTFTKVSTGESLEMVEKAVVAVVDNDYVYSVKFKYGSLTYTFVLLGIHSSGNKTALFESIGLSPSEDIYVSSAGLYLHGTTVFIVGMASCTLEIGDYLKQLDEKYIPDTIARTSDVTDAISAALAALGLPTPTAADAGKILRVNSEGKYELVALPNAEEATF